MSKSHVSGPWVSTGGYNLDNDTQVITSGGHMVGNQMIFLQGDAELDLTSTSSSADILASGDLTAAMGGDTVIPVRIWALVTEAVAADNTAPIVTCEDTSDNSTGLTLTFTDGDAINDIATAAVSDGDAMTAVDVTSEGLRVDVTTAAADAGTAAGKAKVILECLLVK